MPGTGFGLWAEKEANRWEENAPESGGRNGEKRGGTDEAQGAVQRGKTGG